MKDTNSTQKCYNSFSCIGAILIIIFVLGSIIWDICITKPAMRRAIEEIRIEVKDMHNKLNNKLSSDTIEFGNAVQLIHEDSVINKNILNK